MKLVILESPFRPRVPAELTTSDPAAAERLYQRELAYNLKYARAAMRDCTLNHNESPSASHLLLTQEGVLDDRYPHERDLGIRAGLAWRHVSEGSVVYLDRGLSTGMKLGIEAAISAGKSIIYRRLPNDVFNALNIPTIEIDAGTLQELGISQDMLSSAA